MTVADRAVRIVEGYLSLTSAARGLPDFLIIGAQRGATTSLYRYLSQHPQIVPTLIAKGVHYFDTGFNRSPGWYRGHFPVDLYRRALSHRLGLPVLTGEASPYYLFHPHAPRRAAQIVPDARLIVMLREPAARALSHYSHEVAGGFEPLATFEEAIAAERERVEPEQERIMNDESYVSFAHQHFSYLTRGRYAEQLLRWLDQFPRSQMLAVSTERFCADPAGEFARVVHFLELEPPPVLQFRPFNAHAYDSMRPTTRRRLQAEFAPLNQHLFALLDDDLGWET
jgi:Sulfotransferase domain